MRKKYIFKRIINSKSRFSPFRIVSSYLRAVANYETTDYNQPAEAKVLILAKYPIPGLCKTRMQPLLGPEGAAELQSHLGKHTLANALKRKVFQNTDIEVHYDLGQILALQRE